METIPEPAQTLRERIGYRIAGNGHNGHASELIGRSAMATGQASVFKSRAHAINVDETIPDYEFWDKLRRGKAHGYTLGGLFARRIEQIFASWTLGRGVTVALDEGGDPDNPDDQRSYTDGELARFLGANQSLLLRAEMDKIGLGDQFVIVNADGTLSVPSPDTVTVERDKMDYRQILSVTIETRLAKQTIIDEYRDDGRTVTIREGGRVVEVMEYPNLIGRVPVVHLAHDRSVNETNGHPIHEPLRALYDQYDDVAYKQLDGVKLLGNPLLAFVGMEDINAVQNANDPATQDTYTDKDGATATRTQLNIDQNAMLLVGKGGDAKFVAPPTGFTEDTKNALKTLFMLLLDHTGIPEFIWGGEMGSSRASTDTQMTQWARDIEARQKGDENWLLPLCEIWLMTAALTDARLVVDTLRAEWPPLIEEDHDMRLKRIDMAQARGILSDKTALELLGLVDDPAAEIEAAQAEAEAKTERYFPQGSTPAFRQRLDQDQDQE